MQYTSIHHVGISCRNSLALSQFWTRWVFLWRWETTLFFSWYSWFLLFSHLSETAKKLNLPNRLRETLAFLQGHVVKSHKNQRKVRKTRETSWTHPNLSFFPWFFHHFLEAFSQLPAPSGQSSARPAQMSLTASSSAVVKKNQVMEVGRCWKMVIMEKWWIRMVYHG